MFEKTNGTRAEVWHGTAKKTSGGLTKTHLMMNKHGRIVSRRKHASGKKSIKHLEKLGYKAKKGHFMLFRKGHKGSKKMRGGTGAPMGTGFPNASPMGKALSRGGSRRRKHGGTVNYALSPSPISGIKSTSGVDVQFLAGNAG